MSRPRFLLFVGLVLFLPASLLAQLSGTYTIGGLSPDYVTIADAVDDLEAQGISAPVIFNIRVGTYDERITIPAFTRFGGVSDLVTFRKNPGGGSLIWQNSTATFLTNWVVSLDGADWVKFENITFQASEPTSTFGRLVTLSNQATSNQFSNCVFTGFPYVDSDETTLIFEADDTDNNGNSFSSSRFENGYHGIFMDSPGSVSSVATKILGNVFDDQMKGAVESKGSNTRIWDNISFSDSNSRNDYSAFVTTGAGTTVIRNQIDMSRGAYGIRLLDGGDLTNTVDQVVNNMVSIRSGFTIAGIFVARPDARILHNSVVLKGIGDFPVALRLGDIAPGDQMSVRNNLLLNFNGGSALKVDDVDDLVDTDYNNYYSTGSFPIEAEGSPNTLETWKLQTFFDLHSISKSIVFENILNVPYDLHLANASIGDTDLAAPPTFFADVDIDGEDRPDRRTYMGADEADTQLYVELDLTAYLSGPYNESTNKMNADLNLVMQTEALSSPYDQAPYNCGLAESVDVDFLQDHTDIVDWVCIQLVTGSPASPPMEVVAERAGFLLQDGSIVSHENIAYDIFLEQIPGLYWVVLIHRNHLSIMSSNPVNALDGSGSYDFVSLNALGTNPQKSLPGGIFGMWGGDGKWDESVTAFDFLQSWLPVNGSGSGYYTGDFDMNATPSAFDFLNVFLPANGLSSQVPERSE